MPSAPSEDVHFLQGNICYSSTIQKKAVCGKCEEVRLKTLPIFKKEVTDEGAGDYKVPAIF